MLTLCREPYRLLFPLGALYGIWGAALWNLFFLGMLSEYPVWLHSQVMIGGFLTCFAFGFLMTAIPRMTRSSAPSYFELGSVVLPLAFLPLAALISNKPLYVSLCVLISFVAMIRFAVVRFSRLAVSPPQPFIFIGIGLASGFIGVLLQTLNAFGLTSANLQTLSKLLFLQSFILALVLGVGSRLIPALLGRGSLPNVISDKPARVMSFRNPFVSLAILFVGSYFIETFGLELQGRAVRASVAMFIAIQYWKLHQLPLSKTKLALSLWLSGWLTVIGMVGATIWPENSVGLLHITFIGGLSLMTLMVASRVVLAHGGFNLLLEARLNALYLIAVAMVLAAVFRYMSIKSFSYVPVGAGLWIFAMLVWVSAIGWRVARPLASHGHC